jgi:excisionase family DNA binding protein
MGFGRSTMAPEGDDMSAKREVTEERAQRRRWLSILGAAAHAAVSVPTIERWLKDGKLTRYRPADTRRVLIDCRQLDELIVAGAASR